MRTAGRTLGRAGETPMSALPEFSSARGTLVRATTRSQPDTCCSARASGSARCRCSRPPRPPPTRGGGSSGAARSSHLRPEHGRRPAVLEAAAGAVHDTAGAARRRRPGGVAGGRPRGRAPRAGVRLPARGAAGRSARPARSRPSRSRCSELWLRDLAHGYSEGLAVALALWAVESHLDGHRGRAARPRRPGRAVAAGGVAVRARLPAALVRPQRRRWPLLLGAVVVPPRCGSCPTGGAPATRSTRAPSRT